MTAHPEGWTCHHPACQPRRHWAVRLLINGAAFAWCSLLVFGGRR